MRASAACDGQVSDNPKQKRPHVTVSFLLAPYIRQANPPTQRTSCDATPSLARVEEDVQVAPFTTQLFTPFL